MSTRHIAFAALACALSVATGLAQNQSKTFDFASKPGPQALQEAATVLRTVGDIRQLSVDSAASTTVTNGVPPHRPGTSTSLRARTRPSTSPVTDQEARCPRLHDALDHARRPPTPLWTLRRSSRGARCTARMELWRRTGGSNGYRCGGEWRPQAPIAGSQRSFPFQLA